MFLKKNVLLPVLFALMLALAACGGNRNDDDNGDTATPAPTVAPADENGDETDPPENGGQGIAAVEDPPWMHMDFTGQTISMIGSEGYQWLEDMMHNWGYAFYMAILEWQEYTGATFQFLPGMEIPAVVASLAAGDGFDLQPTGAFFIINDHYYHLCDYVDFFRERYGEQLVNIRGTHTFNGRYVSINWPWTLASTAMIYNADLLVRLGFERPAELFMRGEWTWDAFFDLANRMGTLDLTGDGNPDFVAAMHQTFFNFMVNVYEEPGDDGIKINTADTQRVRDLADMIYTGFLYGIFEEVSVFPWSNWFFTGDRYPWIAAIGIPHYDPTCFFGFRDGNGDILEWVPMPLYGDESDLVTNPPPLSSQAISILRGAQNKYAALHFINFAINAVGDSAMQMVHRGERDLGFVGMTGRTPESAYFLEWWRNFIDAEWARFENSPFFCMDYYNAALDHWASIQPRHGLPHGWRGSLFFVPEFTVFINEPPATAMPQFVEWLQGGIDYHNEQVMSVAR